MTTAAPGPDPVTAAVTGPVPAPAAQHRLRVALLTREYPPEVYGGAACT